jgi:hypothetical protein
MMKYLVCAAVACAALGAQAADLVVIANPAVGPLTKDQVADLFLGKNQSLTPVDQPEA